MTLDPLAQIDAVTIIAVVAIFLVTLLLLRRTCLVPLIEFTEARATRIAAAHDDKRAAEATLASAKHDAKTILDAAQADADRATESANQEIAARRRAVLDVARTKAEAILADGKHDIDVLVEEEQQRLSEDLHVCARGALGKILPSVDDTAVRFAVARALGTPERSRA